MSYFIGELDLRVKDDAGDLWELLQPFGFDSDKLGLVVVPAGFVSDLASVPRLPFAYMVVGGRGKKAAVLHDWCYSSQFCTRAEADDLFAEALKASGYGATVRGLMWAGVRAGGWAAWDRPNVPQAPDVQELMAP